MNSGGANELRSSYRVQNEQMKMDAQGALLYRKMEMLVVYPAFGRGSCFTCIRALAMLFLRLQLLLFTRPTAFRHFGLLFHFGHVLSHCRFHYVLQNDIDLLNPPAELEKRKHKLKRLVQSPNSFFMDVKCQGCFNITTVFSHSQTVVVCGNCQTVLCQPTGGKARLTEGCSFRKKGD
ncbi:hypothetical protein KIW84_066194 [Lathyrus oleraceus]|uniref:40S ribosomal protein S27 n=1 Tax=Pisum sativum TaxID=3888 RepID=A0A9D4WGS6_PEA|nr:hypothetical protein KIW84_066194 [Pisum sativum]